MYLVKTIYLTSLLNGIYWLTVEALCGCTVGTTLASGNDCLVALCGCTVGTTLASGNDCLEALGALWVLHLRQVMTAWRHWVYCGYYTFVR